jgi:hypothetical protein
MLKFRQVLVAVGLAACLALTACNTEAATSDQITQSFNTLTEAQKAELIKQAATMQVQNANDPFHETTEALSTADTVNKYTDIAIKVTQALAAGAKELGVAVNSFLDTPAGKWTLGIIIYKTMGADIMMAISAFVVLIVGFTIIITIARRMRTIDIKYNKEKTTWFGNHPVISVNKSPFTDTDIWFLTIWSFITLGLSVVLMLNVG